MNWSEYKKTILSLTKEEVSQLEMRAKTEESLTRMFKIIDFESTNGLLEAVNNAILSGVKPVEIVEVLNLLSDNKRKQYEPLLKDLDL